MQGAIAMSPVAVDGKVFVGDFGDRIYQIDPETGKVLWTFEDGVDWFWATPTVGEAALYFVDVQGNVFAFDRTSLDLLWQAQVKDVVRGQSVLSADETLLYVPGYERGLIYVLETETGEKIPWGELPATPGRIPSDLVADAERVYAMPILIEDRLQAFSADNGKLLWQYPPKAE
jgi:outer membrane protein assembly factor BamB